jgi:hypothetical protein
VEYKRLHRKIGIETEAKFYSLFKGGKGPDSKKHWLRISLVLEFISI